MSWPSTETVPLVGVDDAADDADQRRLAGAVGAEQREDLAAADLEVDVLESVEAGGVGLGDAGDGDDGWWHKDPIVIVRPTVPQRDPLSAKIRRG